MYRQDSNTKKRLLEQGPPLREGDKGLKVSWYNDKNSKISWFRVTLSLMLQDEKKIKKNILCLVFEDAWSRLFHELINAVSSASHFAWALSCTSASQIT